MGGNTHDLVPVECDQRHAQPRLVPEQLIDDNIVGCNPAHPAKIAEGLEDVAGEEVPAEAPRKRVRKEALAREAGSVADPDVLLRVERVEERAGDEVRGPDHGRRLHKISSTNAAY